MDVSAKLQASPAFRVLLVGNYPPDGQESMFRFSRAISAGLGLRGIQVDEVVPKAVLGGRGASPHSGIAKWLGYMDKLLLFPQRLKRVVARVRRLEPAGSGRVPLIVHLCDHSSAIYTWHLRDVPHVVTCHDLLAIRSARGEIPQNRTRWAGRRFQAAILAGLNRAQHVACVSGTTHHDLMRLTSLTPGRTSVVLNSLNYPFAPIPVEEARSRAEAACRRRGCGDPGPNFLLHVGGNPWYKNRLGVLRIYARLVERGESPRLVMVGAAFTAEMKALIAEEHLENRVLGVEACSTEELAALYSAAGALLFPSLAEGFGWPVIEAQACGCPVICSDVQPLPEVAGEGAILLDPKDEQAFADRLRQLLTDPDARFGIITKGYANADRFGPEKMVSGYLERYAALATLSVSSGAEGVARAASMCGSPSNSV